MFNTPDNICEVCCGQTDSIPNCICGGTGLQSEAVVNMRMLINKYEDALYEIKQYAFSRRYCSEEAQTIWEMANKSLDGPS